MYWSVGAHHGWTKLQDLSNFGKFRSLTILSFCIEFVVYGLVRQSGRGWMGDGEGCLLEIRTIFALIVQCMTCTCHLIFAHVL